MVTNLEMISMAQDLVSRLSNVPAQPTAAGLIPDAPIMRKQTSSSTMSFVGITRRGTAWTRQVGTSPWKATLAIVGLVLFLIIMYVVVFAWYVVVLGLFGVLTF